VTLFEAGVLILWGVTLNVWIVTVMVLHRLATHAILGVKSWVVGGLKIYAAAHDLPKSRQPLKGIE
jgi:hypothetical protein